MAPALEVETETPVQPPPPLALRVRLFRCACQPLMTHMAADPSCVVCPVATWPSCVWVTVRCLIACDFAPSHQDGAGEADASPGQGDRGQVAALRNPEDHKL